MNDQPGKIAPPDRSADQQSVADTCSFPQASTPPQPRPALEPILPAGTRIGKFVVLAHLGQGGFGSVYHCRDTQLQREVALKLPRPGSLAGREDEERFLREARAAAQLSHPQIVPVYEAGEIDGQFFIASKYVRGRTLRDAIRQEKRWDPAEAARVVGQLAAALHFAHLHGVFHRDVKPENILLDEANQPYLMDFGLARRLEGESLRTEEGLRLGTPAYMSPEQAEGRSHLADARSDQWALGVVLYELLAGERPFRGEVVHLIAAIAQADPAPPRTLRSEIPLDLETIALKCLEKSPERRYPSCQHLAEELERWLRGDAIEARPPAWWEAAWRLVRRNLVATGVIAATLIAGIVGGVYYQTRPAYLDLRVTPPEAAATLGDRELSLSGGRAVVTGAPGRHRLVVRAADYLPAEQEVLLVRGSENTAVVQVDLRSSFGYMRVESDPPGAALAVMDAKGAKVAEGTTPFHSPRMKAGSYSVQLSKPLFTDAQTKVEVPTGDRVGPLARLKLSASVAGGNSYDQLLQAIQRLERPIRGEWKFNKLSLHEVAAAISQLEQVEVAVDVDSVEQLGVSPFARSVTYQSSRGGLQENLDDLLRPLKLFFDVRLRQAGMRIEIHSVEGERRRFQTVVYPVAGIASIRGVDFDPLINQLEESIEPDTWNSVGGWGTIKRVLNPPSLTISHNFRVHAKLLKLLTTLQENSSK